MQNMYNNKNKCHKLLTGHINGILRYRCKKNFEKSRIENLVNGIIIVFTILI